MDSCLAGLRDRGFAPRVVLDVGASDGSWTRLAMRLWPDASYHLFEPLAHWTTTLGALAEQPTVHYHQVALSNRDGTAPIGVTPDLYGSSLAYGGATSEDVRLARLDSLAASIDGPVDLVKIDVQGHEPEVIAGGRAIREAAVVILETYFFRFADSMRLFRETMNLMHDCGFEPYEILDQLRRPRDGAVGQCDVCFVRADHALRASRSWL